MKGIYYVRKVEKMAAYYMSLVMSLSDRLSEIYEEFKYEKILCFFTDFQVLRDLIK